MRIPSGAKAVREQKKKPARTKAEQSQRTRQSILSAAQSLFNAHGIQGTTIFKIASAIGITPGNLNYYFAYKADIVRALAEDLELRLRGALTGLSIPFSPEQIVDRTVHIYRILWNHRYFFNSGAYLAGMDHELANQYSEIHAHLLSILTSYLQEVAQQGGIRQPARRHGPQLIAMNIVSVWLQWLYQQSMKTPLAEQADKAVLRELMELHWSIIEPYMRPDVFESLLKEADRVLGPFKSKIPATPRAPTTSPQAVKLIA